MESNYSNRDFEQFVKQNADEYRMFPSEKVWSGINNSLHTRRRWTGFGLAFLLLLTGGAVSWVMTMYPASKKSQDIASVKPTAPGNDLSSGSNESATTAQAQQKKQSRKLHGLLPFNKESDQPTTIKNQSAPIVIQDALSEQLRQNIAEQLPAPSVPAHTELIERVEKIGTPAHATRIKHAADPASTPAISIATAETLSSPAIAVPVAAKDNAPLQKQNLQEPPLTIESVVNSYKREKVHKKLSWQLFITPTISYRKLGVNKAYNNTAATGYPLSPALTDVNQAVTHKPDIGLQLGFAARYPLTNALKLRAGLQFNVNRYDIKAFSYSGEMATIGLNPGSSSVSAYTRYRNYSGYRADWLKNFYYTVSVPIGAELKVLGNEKTSFGVAGTIQPTYVISDGAYLLSTDYKNYAKVPWLTRNFNLSTGFEAFINYTSGKTQWQIGPQVRYQLLSSFENKYPVKENLFDFGVKIGVTLNQ
ncbi:MAG: hypothetical protein DI535_01200 [Citrobacter freundii]|nr:MAG: hypothetical protein DI535_01200 [Citrobacter freundii]